MLIMIALCRFSSITSSMNRNGRLASKTNYCFSIFTFLWLMFNLTISILDIIKYNDCTVYMNVTTITWSKLVSVIIDVILIMILAYMLEKISLSYFNHTKRVEAKNASYPNTMSNASPVTPHLDTKSGSDKKTSDYSYHSISLKKRQNQINSKRQSSHHVFKRDQNVLEESELKPDSDHIVRQG